MIEITREERNKILRKLTKIAKTLAIQATIDRFDVTEKEAKENPIDYRYWLSTDHKTCYYGGNRSLPIDYHIKKKRNVIFLIHFLPEHCENVFANSEYVAECLCTVREGNKYKFYHTTHLVGDCPHKETL